MHLLLQHYDLLHELGHVIGRHHEQMRPDRDNYVTILEENIEEIERPWFARLEWGSVRSFGVNYDYWSVMHYPQYVGLLQFFYHSLRPDIE